MKTLTLTDNELRVLREALLEQTTYGGELVRALMEKIRKARNGEAV